jgi:hypothetical protein
MKLNQPCKASWAAYVDPLESVQEPLVIFGTIFAVINPGPLTPGHLLLTELAFDELGAAEAGQEGGEQDPKSHH